MKNSTQKKAILQFSVILLHSLGWLIYITYELTLNYYISHVFDPPYIYAVYYAINIAYFYSVIYILRRNIDRSKAHIVFLGLQIAILFIFAFCVKSAADYFEAELPTVSVPKIVYIKRFWPGNLFREFYFTILAVFSWVTGYIAYFKKEARDLEKKQLLAKMENTELEIRLNKSQNAFLRQQLSPHLLFNTFNFIYSKVHDVSDQASDCILLISDLLRYSLEEISGDEKVPLGKEIDQLLNLRQINDYRFDGKLYLNIEQHGKFDDLRIIPLILLTLTENVFKHGNLSEPLHPGNIVINADKNGVLSYLSRNLIKSDQDDRSNLAIGLSNTKVRLDYSYQDNYQMNVKIDDDFFELSLNLQL